MKTNKYLSVISLIVSVIAIGMCAFTLVKVNSCDVKTSDIPAPVIKSGSDSTSLRLAFINTDTLMVRYKLVSELVAEIDAQKSELDADFAKQRDQFQKDVDYFQEQVNKGSLSEQSAMEIYEKLMSRQEELLILQEEYTARMAVLEQEQTNILYEKVINYLNRFNKDYRFYDFVFNYSILNSAILNANTCYDITDYIVSGLNSEYEAENKKK